MEYANYVREKLGDNRKAFWNYNVYNSFNNKDNFLKSRLMDNNEHRVKLKQNIPMNSSGRKQNILGLTNFGVSGAKIFSIQVSRK